VPTHIDSFILKCVGILCQNCVRYPLKPRSNKVIYIDYEFGLWAHNDFLIIKPNGMNEEIGRNLDAEARRRFDQRIRNAPPEQRLGLCVLMICGLVKTVSQYNDTVGEQCLLGTMTPHRTSFAFQASLKILMLLNGTSNRENSWADT
jgi:hypothetical protein